MKSNSLKRRIDLLGLDYKKEMIKIIVTNAILVISAITVTIIVKQMYIAMIFISLLAVLNYVLINSYSSKEKELQKERDDEFVSIISYFEIFIDNGFNVYQSFNHLIPVSSSYMKGKIEEFLQQVDGDKSIKPFIDFSNNFTLSAARNIMISIYQMVDSGTSSTQLLHFNYTFREVNKNHIIEMKERKDKSLSNMTIFPMVGSALIILILCFSVIFVMGDMINVI